MGGYNRQRVAMESKISTGHCRCNAKLRQFLVCLSPSPVKLKNFLLVFQGSLGGDRPALHCLISSLFFLPATFISHLASESHETTCVQVWLQCTGQQARKKGGSTLPNPRLVLAWKATHQWTPSAWISSLLCLLWGTKPALAAFSL